MPNTNGPPAILDADDVLIAIAAVALVASVSIFIVVKTISLIKDYVEERYVDFLTNLTLPSNFSNPLTQHPILAHILGFPHSCILFPLHNIIYSFGILRFFHCRHSPSSLAFDFLIRLESVIVYRY